MAKTVSPRKVIIELNEDGTFKRGVITYMISVDGVWDSKMRTIGIAEGVAKTQAAKGILNGVLGNAVQHILKGEKII